MSYGNILHKVLNGSLWNVYKHNQVNNHFDITKPKNLQRSLLHLIHMWTFCLFAEGISIKAATRMFIQNDHPSILQYAEKLSDLFANKLTSNLLQISLLAHTLEKPLCKTHVAYAKIRLCIHTVGHLLSLALYLQKMRMLRNQKVKGWSACVVAVADLRFRSSPLAVYGCPHTITFFSCVAAIIFYKDQMMTISPLAVFLWVVTALYGYT